MRLSKGARQLGLLLWILAAGCARDGWDSYAEPLFDHRCAPCHAGYSSYEIVEQDQNRIASKIEAGAMPPDGGLPPEDRRRVLAWIDRGLPE